MRKTLIKHGNSHALLIDKAILELLKIDPKTTKLEVVTDGTVLVITPVRNDQAQKELKDQLASVDTKYSGVFKRLADR